MKKTILLFIFFLAQFTVLAQKPIDASFSLSPAFPIGELKDYVSGGFGFFGAVQTEMKKNFAIGGEVSLHVLSEEDYAENSFFSFSAYVNRYFETSYVLGRAPLKPYLGMGMGLYRSTYEDAFFGRDPAQAGVLFSPRLGIRMDVDNLFLAAEGRFHLGTGYADSYVPLLITMGYRFGGGKP